MVVSNNRWASEEKYSNASVVVNGQFKRARNVIFSGNVADDKWTVRSTRAVRSVTVPANQNQAKFNFAPDLLFPRIPIAYALCSVQSLISNTQATVATADDTVIPHSLEPFAALELTVRLPSSHPGVVVTCEVDQSERLHSGV